jgi:hypothetical protein
MKILNTAEMNRKILLILVFALSILFCSGQYPNVLIDNTGYPEEPSIVVSPKQPSKIVAGSNTTNYYYSDDGGYSWQKGTLTSTYGVMGDPCLLTDTAGNFCYIHLSDPPSGHWIDRIVFQKSLNGGQLWSDGTYMGLNGSKAQDKAWAAVDPTTNAIYVTWTQFDEYGTANQNDSSIILFSGSTDDGQSWSPAKRINRVAGDCIDSDSTVEGAVPAVGPNGEIYVAWAGPLGLLLNRSLDGGVTWMDTNIFVADMPGGWDYQIPGIYRCNGLPVTCCDLSNGPFRGNLYVNWTDQRNGLTDTDVWFVKSTDGGMTWCSPKRVNDDPAGSQQFFTWMTVDQKTGFIWFVFYDRRENSNLGTDVYMAVSRDGGETFQNFKVSDSPFYPNQSIFFGDYTNISAYNNTVRPIWTRLNSSVMGVYTAIIDSMYLGISKNLDDVLPLSLEQNRPNPVKDVTTISFDVRVSSMITLRVLDIFGREIATIVNHRRFNAGEYTESFDAAAHHLTPGVYYFSLVSGETSLQRKMLIE